jgi:Tol biopolymer transport system component
VAIRLALSVLVLSIGALGLACGGGGSKTVDSSVASEAAAAGKIAFVRYAEGSRAIYSISADGSGLSKLADYSGRVLNLAWSPDRSRVVFDSPRGDDYDLKIMDRDGSDLSTLTPLTSEVLHLSWSPDGTRILFVSTLEGNNRGTFQVNADGTGLTRLLDDDSGAHWLPDGERIFSGSRIWRVNSDGSGVTTLPDLPAPAHDWSPDGKRFVYVARASAPSGSQMYVMNADGSGQRQLTGEIANEQSPTWSPDGKRIAFFSDRDGDDRVYVMNADGSNQVRVSDVPCGTSYLSWSPDSIRVAFVSDTYSSDYAPDVFVANADGSGDLQLTLSEAGEADPEWLP